VILTANSQVVSFMAGAFIRTARPGGVVTQVALASTFRTGSLAPVQLAALLANPRQGLTALASRLYDDIYGGRHYNRGTLASVVRGLSAPDQSGFVLTKDGIVLAFFSGGEAPGYILLPYSFASRYMSVLGRELVRTITTEATVSQSWVHVRDRIS
jgi:hypothetical protein